ncbi:MAG TPA: hypothetical protein DCX07_05910 [Phycisphaerales bacterium]|nr:hypothetical protein [Phycisphaerales bacterium]
MKTRFAHAYVLNVMSDDHPGIVASVGRAIAEMGGNIDSCSQTVLEGYFTLIMIVSLPETVAPDALAQRVRGADPSGLEVVARAFLPPAYAQTKGETDRFVVTAFGTDRPGIIHRISQYLAGKDINISDFYWHRAGDDFVLIGEVDVPVRWDVAMLQVDLEQMGKEEGFTVKLQHENIFVATNQLRLTR